MDGAGLWPWWLWALAALWVGTGLIWRPAPTAPREPIAWIAVAVMYAGLIVFVARIVPTTANAPEPIAWPVWLALVAFLISAIACVGVTHLPWQRWANGTAALFAGLLLALLHAPEAACTCGVLAWGLARTPSEATEHTVEAVPKPDHWLIGLAAVVTLVVTIGLCRHALVVESANHGASRSQTAFPTRERLTRHRAVNTSPPHLSPEVWGLIVITGIALFTMVRSPLATVHGQNGRA